MYRAELLSRYHELATDMQARGTLPRFGAMLERLWRVGVTN